MATLANTLTCIQLWMPNRHVGRVQKGGATVEMGQGRTIYVYVCVCVYTFLATHTKIYMHNRQQGLDVGSLEKYVSLISCSSDSSDASV